MWKEIPVFIHGVTYRKMESPPYGAFLRLVNRELEKEGKKPLANPLFVSWGQENGSHQNDRFLAEAESMMGERVRRATAGIRDSTLNPLRFLHRDIRRRFLLGFSDLFYYVSKDGENSVRKTVFEYLSRNICKACEENISLTFFSHSAGTVIAHDFLYHLFRKKVSKDLEELRALVKEGKVRIRKFYTFGSPLTPLMFRSDSLLTKMVQDRKLTPEEMGLAEKNQWLNFWDMDDLFSYPLSFLYSGESVRDVYVDLGDVFPAVHNTYWFSETIARIIARHY